jgi:hypothetical protein
MTVATELYANNASSNLAGNITNVATTANLTPGSGTLFPSPGANQFFHATLTDAATGLLNEIVVVTNVTGDTVTMIRGVEGTTALAWLAGDFFSNLITAGTLENLVQPGVLQIQSGNYGTDGGSANALNVSLAIIPVSLASIIGSAFRVKKSAAANTSAVTMVLGGLASTPVVHADGTPLTSGELPANGIFTVVYDGTNFVLQSTSAAGTVTLSQLQIQPGNYSSDTGTANAMVVTLSPVPASLASIIGTPIRVNKGVSNNTGSATLKVNTLATTAVVWGDGSAMRNGDLPGGALFTVAYDGTAFVLQSVPDATLTSASAQAQAGNYAADTGAANAYACTLTPALGAHTVGLPIRVLISNSNTTASTLNPGPGVKSIKNADGSALVSGQLVAGGIAEFKYDGTNYQLVPLQAGTVTPAQLQTQTGNYHADSGTANAMVVALSPVPASLASMLGSAIRIEKAGSPNTTATTLALNGFTATPITWGDGTAMRSGDLPGGSLIEVSYDGTNFTLLSTPNVPSTVASSQAQGTNYAADTGSANSYSCTLSPALAAHTTGMPIRVKIAHNNTGGSTFNPGPGAVVVHDSDGKAVTGGMIAIGMIAEFIYNGTAYQLMNPALGATLSTNGFIILPGGFYMQWGTESFATGAGNPWFDHAFTFPIAFPNNCFNVVATGQDKFNGTSPGGGGGVLDIVIVDDSTVTTTGATLHIDNNVGTNLTGTHSVFWQAIGN